MKKLFSYIKNNRDILLHSFVDALPQMIELAIVITVMGYLISIE